MNRKLIIRLLGAMMAIVALAMIPSFLLALYFGDGDAPVLAGCAGGLLVPGLLIWFLVRPGARATHLRLREGFLVVGLGWVVLSAGGALPFFFSGLYPRFEDALFESVSGFTTTGATVLLEYEHFPRGIMFWRGTTHWVGGMGVLMLTLALLPKLTGRTSHLVRAESPGPSLSKLVPHTGATAIILYRIYILLTLLEFLALQLCGLNAYDAALHSLSTAGTGGFSNYSASVGAFQSPAVDAVITFFMFLFGVNFAQYYRFLISPPKEKLTSFFRDEEFRWYLSIVLLLIALLTGLNLSYYGSDLLVSLRYSAFQLCSIISTTGFVTWNFNLWPVASRMLVFLAMFLGACAGSTAGGIKMVRVALAAKNARRAVRSTDQPKKVLVVRMDGKAIDESMLSQISIFIIVYVALVVIGGFLLSLEGKFAPMDNLSAALTCVSNVGPAFGALASDFAGYGPFGKLLCSFLMLAGRLELFPILLLFTRSAWKSK
ncbi:MAG: TrkH family potassium uptake protein [Clostridia bacterium]|nr:TrkH family potassium uptake protein [Clostridia bacterium]